MVSIEDNIFMKYIYNRPVFDKNKGILFSSTRYLEKRLDQKKYKKFLKELKNEDLSFDLLWQFADFIKLLEEVFFYDNIQTSKYYSNTSIYTKDNTKNHFRIKREELAINISLQDNDNEQIIELDVLRYKGSKSKTTFIIVNRQTDFNSVHEINLIYNINKILCKEMIALLEEYYKWDA